MNDNEKDKVADNDWFFKPVDDDGEPIVTDLVVPVTDNDTIDDYISKLEAGSVKLSKESRDMVMDVLSSDTTGSVGDNLITFKDVLLSSKCKMSTYINAVHYITHKLSGLDNYQSYCLVFSEQVDQFYQDGLTESDVRKKANAFNATKLVGRIAEVSLIPSYILNNHLFQEALNVQVSIMRDDLVSPKVRSDAAKEVLRHTQIPETLFTNKEELSTQVSSVIDMLSKVADKVADGIVDSVKAGADLRQIAESKLYEEVEVEDGDD